jgi:hypothetical protein
MMGSGGIDIFELYERVVVSDGRVGTIVEIMGNGMDYGVDFSEPEFDFGIFSKEELAPVRTGGSEDKLI